MLDLLCAQYCMFHNEMRYSGFSVKTLTLLLSLEPEEHVSQSSLNRSFVYFCNVCWSQWMMLG